MLPYDGTAIRCIRIIRFTIMLGPWKDLIVKLLCRRFRDRTFPRAAPTIFPDLDIGIASEGLHRDGFALGLQLRQSSIERIREFSAGRMVVREAHRDCGEINRIAHDIAIVEVVRNYLGVEPVLQGSSLFWTLPNNSVNASYPEKFHYDVGDFKSVCVCFYLTDVTFDCAPHVVIAGTHKKKSIARLINPFMTDDDATRRFGANVTTLTGKAGTGFFEDHLAQHKRGPCAKPRLVLFIEYMLRRR
jgi:hypothetical protein